MEIFVVCLFVSYNNASCQLMLLLQAPGECLPKQSRKAD